MGVIKEGVNNIIPLDMLKLLTWEEVESRACGDKIIDTDKLKSITQYEGGREDHEGIIRFWRVFSELTEEEKQLYLKFVWGRSRLPYDTSDLRYNHKIAFIESRGNS